MGQIDTKKKAWRSLITHDEIAARSGSQAGFASFGAVLVVQISPVDSRAPCVQM